MARSAQARLLAANVMRADGQTRFVQTAHDHRDGTLGGVFSRSVRGITPQAVPIPITFDYAKTSFTPLRKQAAQELATALKKNRPGPSQQVGHHERRGSSETNPQLFSR